MEDQFENQEKKEEEEFAEEEFAEEEEAEDQEDNEQYYIELIEGIAEVTGPLTGQQVTGMYVSYFC